MEILDEYQTQAASTCMETSDNIGYLCCGLTAEVGELNDKIAKGIRKGYMRISHNELYILHDGEWKLFSEVSHDPRYADIIKELGDIQWFVALLARSFGFKLSEIAEQNLAKLADRKKRGVIDGNGDNR